MVDRFGSEADREAATVENCYCRKGLVGCDREPDSNVSQAAACAAR